MEASEAGFKAHSIWNQRRGGFRACSFIFVMQSLESMGFVANMASMVLYFLYKMFLDLSTAATTLTNFMGTTFLLTILGGFISDTYLSRFNTSLIFGVIEVLGLMMLTIQAHFPSLRPSFCVPGPDCVKGGKAIMFYGSLYLLALGSGGVKGCLPALGADQFNGKDPKEKKHQASYFNYMLLSITFGAMIGVTIIVWVSINKGWALGFLISMLSTIVGYCILILGKPFYRDRVPGYSPLTRVIQVLVATIRNHSLPIPENSEELYEIYDKEDFEEEKLSRTNQFRLFDKAAIKQEGLAPNPWKLCTVTQVEEVKILTRMMPIIASTIIMNTCLAQLQTFSIQQGNAMNLHLGKFKVPPSSIPVIPLLFMAILIPIYEFIFVPFIRKFTHHPTGITQLQRVGVGLVLSSISMGVAGIIEAKRRNAFNHDGKQISLFWLSFQYGIFGIADMFTLVGLMEFFYSEAPAGMKSLSTSFSWLSLSFGCYLSSIFVELINSVTSKLTKSKQGWLHGADLNQNNLNLFYWFLAVLSCINFANYLYWASWYKYKVEVPEKEEKDLDGSPPHKKETKALNGSPPHKEETKALNGSPLHKEETNEEAIFDQNISHSLDSKGDMKEENGDKDPMEKQLTESQELEVR
ncbi:protein NRT1/ PTR FAMILY 4.5-like [Tasmannia lanceolata]|uniref:protein NRT1/ PTR FAMILY 4.5-like n=1 Tax=Tasmannia lanceolata TaxID=3420 RepID=UPI0040646240